MRPDRHRRSIRLPHFDYRQPGAYFVTICAYRHECLFGTITDSELRLSEVGTIVEEEWQRTEVVRPRVALDAFVVMPNHFHGLLWLGTGEIESGSMDLTGRGTPTACPYPGAEAVQPLRQFGKAQADSLPSIIGQFKSIVTKRVRRQQLAYEVWQRGYFEHVIRSERSLNRIRTYIQDNPSRWSSDRYHP